MTKRHKITWGSLFIVAVLAGLVFGAVPDGPYPSVGLYFYTSSDPTSGGGVAAPLGQLAIRQDVPSIYFKSGPTNTAWTLIGTGGGGTVTSIACGTGLSCSPSSPITTAGTINVSLTPTTCVSGSGVSAIAANGTGTCTAFAPASAISGTTTHIPEFTSASTIGDSPMLDNGTTAIVLPSSRILQVATTVTAGVELFSTGIIGAGGSAGTPDIIINPAPLGADTIYAGFPTNNNNAELFSSAGNIFGIGGTASAIGNDPTTTAMSWNILTGVTSAGSSLNMTSHQINNLTDGSSPHDAVALDQLTGAISGTLNTIAKFTPDGSHVGNSLLTDDGTTTTATGFMTIDAQSGDTYPLDIKGTVLQDVTVHAANNGEIYKFHINGDGTPRVTTDGDVAGMVVGIFNTLTFDTTAGANTAISLYGSTNAIRVAGSAGLTNIGVDGAAVGGDFNYAFYAAAGKGTAQFADGGACGPWSVTGDLTQQLGDVTLNTGSGTTTINGNTHISSSNLLVDGTFESGSTATFDGNIRVNGYSNLAGGAGLVYLQSINSSGIPIPISNAIAPTPERLTSSGNADPTIGLTILSGSSIAVALADGTKDGQLKDFAILSGSGTITPAHGLPYTYSGSGGLELTWDNTGGDWRPLASFGSLASGITNAAGNNVVTKSNGTNLVASSITDNGTIVATTEPLQIGLQILSPGTPVASHGSLGVGSTNFVGNIHTIGSNTSLTLTFSAPFGSAAWCFAQPNSTSVALEAIVVTNDRTAPTFSCFNVATGVGANCDDFSYQCVGE